MPCLPLHVQSYLLTSSFIFLTYLMSVCYTMFYLILSYLILSYRIPFYIILLNFTCIISFHQLMYHQLFSLSFSLIVQTIHHAKKTIWFQCNFFSQHFLIYLLRLKNYMKFNEISQFEIIEEKSNLYYVLMR